MPIPTDLANYKGVIPNPGATGDNNNTDMEDGSQSRLKSNGIWSRSVLRP